MAHHFNTIADLKAHIQQLADMANAIADQKDEGAGARRGSCNRSNL